MSFGYGHRFGWGRRRRRDVTPTDPAVNIEKPGCTFNGNRWLGGAVDLPARCGTTQDACE